MDPKVWRITGMTSAQNSATFLNAIFSVVDLGKAFLIFEKTTLAYIGKRINSARYQQILEEHLLPYIKRFCEANLILMQDNA